MGIIKPFLPEDVRESLLERIKETFSKFGGKVVKDDIWGKRHLAYKIKGHEEGYYVLHDVDIDGNKLEEVTQELKMENDLLRFIIIEKN